MKKILIFIFIFTGLKSYSQDLTNVSPVSRLVEEVSTKEKASIFVQPIKYAIKTENYEYFIETDGMIPWEINPYSVVSNLQSNTPYTLTVVDENNEMVYQEKFEITNSEILVIKPSIAWEKGPKFQISAMGGMNLAAGLRIMFNRYLWVGGDLGLSYYPAIDAKAHFFIFTPTFEFGYYFIGDPITDFRFGGGLDIGMHFIAPYKKWEQIILTYYDYEDQIESNALKNYSFFLDTYFIVEWQRYYLKLKIHYDFTRAGFSLLPQVGFKF